MRYLNILEAARAGFDLIQPFHYLLNLVFFVLIHWKYLVYIEQEFIHSNRNIFVYGAGNDTPLSIKHLNLQLILKANHILLGLAV